VAATGVGAMWGALRTGRSGKTHTLRSGSVGLVGYGVCLAAFAVSTSWLVAMVSQLLVGYFYFTVMTSLQTLIQQLVDEAKRGRVMSLFQVSWAGLVPFGSLAMGFLAGPLGTPNTLPLSAAVCTTYGVLMTAVAERWPLHEGTTAKP
jgi:predicted MFS family arabinose efflux permease